MLRLVADDKIPYLREALTGRFDVRYMPGTAMRRRDVADADALIVRTRTRCDRELLEGTRVRAVFTATIGTDHLDTDYLARQGIAWANAPACNASSVAQYCGSALAYLYIYKGYTLRGRVLAVVGAGHVGSLVAGVGLRLGMRVLLVDPPRARAEGAAGFTPYDEALSLADIISFHTPLTTAGEDATWHLFNAASIDRLKTGAVVINTSRGPVVETAALLRALRRGTLAAAVVDVWENEPAIDRALLQEALITTPHIAGYSTDSKLRATCMVVEALCRHFALHNEWTPPTLPVPPNPIVLPSQNADADQAAAEMLLHVYDIQADSLALKDNPDNFEQLRGHYHLRREIDSFAIGAGTPHAGYLRGFGIRVVGGR